MKSGFTTGQKQALSYRLLQRMGQAGWLSSCTIRTDAALDVNWTEEGCLKLALLKHDALWFGLDMDDMAAIAFTAICSGERVAPNSLAMSGNWHDTVRVWHAMMGELAAHAPADVIGVVHVACHWAPDRAGMRVIGLTRRAFDLVSRPEKFFLAKRVLAFNLLNASEQK